MRVLRRVRPLSGIPRVTRSGRLHGEKSPFLQHGAEQPVDWWPWGESAFEHARSVDRPVLLDIGAVWCHWCHVMDRESYEDAGTADLINDRFVAIKVDRDERPDVDARYQRAVQLLTGQGGWPLTAFLTPDGEVFHGGTYFPPTDMHGRPSFRRVLLEIDRVWRQERDRAMEAASSIVARLTARSRSEAEPGNVDDALLDETLEDLAGSFDFRHGGFGRAPKFPAPAALDLLLDRHLDDGTPWALQIVSATLHAMGNGGVFDQIGGGFHRYSTDARWIIPHFEKMAYDNGPLLSTYAAAAAALEDPSCEAIVDGIITHYLDISPDLVAAGGFPASQDADYGSDNDGDYWTWSEAELRAALGDGNDVEIAKLAYGFDDPDTRMHVDPSRHVLYRASNTEAVAAALGEDRSSIEAAMTRIRTRLKAVRDRRPAPFVDRTLYSGWCALVASGHLLAGRYTGRPAAIEAGLRALERIWADGWRADRGILHRLDDDSAGEGLDDQAHTLLAMLDGFEITQDPSWMQRAVSVADVMLSRFRDPATGALTDRPRETPVVAALSRAHLPLADAPTPSGNGAAALGLLRLAVLTGENAPAEAAEGILGALAGTAARLGSSAATFVKATTWVVLPVTTVLIVDEPDRPPSDRLLAAALETYRPRTVVRRIAPSATDRAGLSATLAAMVSRDYPRAYVCCGNTCARPVADPDELREIIRTFARPVRSRNPTSTSRHGNDAQPG